MPRTTSRRASLQIYGDQPKERAKGTSRTAIDLNRFIEEARIKVHQIVTELQQSNEEVNAKIVQDRFYGINPSKKAERTILEVIQAHNDEADKLIGKDYSKPQFCDISR